MDATLAPLLRSLWGLSPHLHEIDVDNKQQTFLSQHGLHLPTERPIKARSRLWFQAAAAHAAAHLV
ncbi:MAG: hypothetical protein P8N60_10275, partial [Burkholderiaceae bacterium]|nr:hypothetical protein [Burkholderiaceae bacterium]